MELIKPEVMFVCKKDPLIDLYVQDLQDRGYASSYLSQDDREILFRAKTSIFVVRLESPRSSLELMQAITRNQHALVIALTENDHGNTGLMARIHGGVWGSVPMTADTHPLLEILEHDITQTLFGSRRLGNIQQNTDSH